MIQEIDRELADWIQTRLGDVRVALEAPNPGLLNSLDDTTGAQLLIDLYLFNLAYQPAASSVPRLPLEITLSYLVTAWAQNPEEEHRAIGELMLAALEEPRFEIGRFQLEKEPWLSKLWLPLQLVPRPAFVLSLPLTKERPYAPAPLVRSVPVVHTSPTQPLRGKLLGPEEIPIAGADVLLPTLQRRTQTDRRGEFVFERVPTHPEIKQLHLRARGRSYVIDLDPTAQRQDPLLIHLRDL